LAEGGFQFTPALHFLDLSNTFLGGVAGPAFVVLAVVVVDVVVVVVVFVDMIVVVSFLAPLVSLFPVDLGIPLVPLGRKRVSALFQRQFEILLAPSNPTLG